MFKKKNDWEKLKAADGKKKRNEALLKQPLTLFTYFSSKQPDLKFSDADLVALNTADAVITSI